MDMQMYREHLAVAMMREDLRLNIVMFSWVYSVEGTAFVCIFYIILGFLSVLCNVLNLSVWLSNRHLKRKYMYLTALDFYELVNAFAYMVVGFGRGLALRGNYLQKPITLRECFFQKYWPHLLILGAQLPSFAIILISCERLCAALRPVMYNRFFTGYSKVILLGMVPIAGIVSLFFGALSTLGKTGDVKLRSQHCGIASSTSQLYSSFHYIFVAFAYIISFIAIVVVWKSLKRITTRRKVGGDNHYGVMLIITGSSGILIGSESAIQLLHLWNIACFSDVVFAIAHGMPAFLSLCNTLVNFAFRTEFREQFFILVGIRKAYCQQHKLRPLTIIT